MGRPVAAGHLVAAVGAVGHQNRLLVVAAVEAVVGHQSRLPAAAAVAEEEDRRLRLRRQE